MKHLTLSTSLVSLLTQLADKCRCARLILAASGRSRFGTWYTAAAMRRAHKYISPDAPGDYLTYRETSGMLSYCPAGREQGFTDAGTWVRKGRQDSKPAKLVAKLLHPRLVRRIKPADLNEFATLFKAAEDAAALTIELSDFPTAYRKANYRPETFESCMWGEPVGEFYSRAGAQVAVCRDGTGVLRGRAILWPSVRMRGVGTVSFLDRIYSDAPEVEAVFCEWAEANGHYRKTSQGRFDKQRFTSPGGEVVSQFAHVTPEKSLDYTNFYPYLDTFTFGDGDGELTNEDSDTQYAYDNTDGTRTGEPEDEHIGEVEDIDGEWLSEDEAIEVGGDWYHYGDDRITKCHRDNNYILASEAYVIRLSRDEVITIHERYVEAP